MKALFSKREPVGKAVGRSSVFALFLTLAGCFAVHMNLPNTTPSIGYNQWVHGWLWGAIGGRADASLCSGRSVVGITTKHSVGNVLAFIFTLGIYSPTSIHIECGQPIGYSGYPLPPQPYPPPQPYQPQPPPAYQPPPAAYQPPPAAYQPPPPPAPPSY